MNITDLFIIIWLLVMGIIDIKKKAVPLALLIIFSVMSIKNKPPCPALNGKIKIIY